MKKREFSRVERVQILKRCLIAAETRDMSLDTILGICTTTVGMPFDKFVDMLHERLEMRVGCRVAVVKETGTLKKGIEGYFGVYLGHEHLVPGIEYVSVLLDDLPEESKIPEVLKIPGAVGNIVFIPRRDVLVITEVRGE